ncbi:MAG: hypothetical protein Q8L78_05320 [Coxiellaceae bacterium]|nr:hypothetical protein [Coxiellaceae bacterium]
MYYLFGYKKLIELVKKASASKLPVDDIKLLGDDYKNYLNSVSVFENDINWDEIRLIDYPSLHVYANNHAEKIKVHIKENSEILKNRLRDGFFQEALTKLEESNFEIFNLAKLVIKMVLINNLNSYTNGTTADTIGLASMDFKDHFNQQDFIELVVHQMTHMYLFMDDKVFNHCDEEKKEIMIETYDIKFILGGTQFPLYLAYHSYIVGVEVLCFREETYGINGDGNYHGKTSRIFKICELFQKALILNTHHFSKRGLGIFEKSVNLFESKKKKYPIFANEL